MISGQITEIEQQIETLQSQLTTLRSKPAKRRKERRDKAPVASTSKAPSKQPKSQHTKKKNKKPIADDDVLTFEQKKDLSESISKLDGAKLERVIQIIHEGVPEIRDVSIPTYVVSLYALNLNLTVVILIIEHGRNRVRN